MSVPCTSHQSTTSTSTHPQRPMQRLTLPSYSNLVTIKPIQGTVYKAKQICSPRPTILPMPLSEVAMHAKNESVTSLLREQNARRSTLDIQSYLEDHSGAIEMSTLDPDGHVASAPHEQPVSVVEERRKGSVWKRLKRSFKKVLQCDLTSNEFGFRSTRYVPDSRPVPPESVAYLQTVRTTCHRTYTPQPISTFSSFTSSSSAPRLPSIHHLPAIHIPSPPPDYNRSPTTSELDIFQDFSGVYCESERSRSESPVVEGFRGRNTSPKGSDGRVHISTSEPTSSPSYPSDPSPYGLRATNPSFSPSSSSSPSSPSASPPDTNTNTATTSPHTTPNLSTPDLSTPPTPNPSYDTISSQDSTWPTHPADTKTPCPNRVVKKGSTWSFDLVAPDSAFSVLQGAGDAARSRRRRWRGVDGSDEREEREEGEDQEK